MFLFSGLLRLHRPNKRESKTFESTNMLTMSIYSFTFLAPFILLRGSRPVLKSRVPGVYGRQKKADRAFFFCSCFCHYRIRVHKEVTKEHKGFFRNDTIRYREPFFRPIIATPSVLLCGSLWNTQQKRPSSRTAFFQNFKSFLYGKALILP